MKIDVIIPVYKPDKSFLKVLDALSAQTIKINKIILMNTEEKYFEQLTYGNHDLEKYDNLKVYHLSKREFDHGNTRRMAVKKSDADIFVMMTQDAMPADQYLLERLISHLEGDVAVAYARQLATKDSGILEVISRQFNYPPESRFKSKEDLETLGIKTFFCSDVCAAYRRETYDALGGFIRQAIFNEDMIFAAQAIKKGYRISYEADACVYHAHNYTNMQQLHRNFDLGVSQADHPEVFANVSSESEGKKLVKAAHSYLKEKHMMSQLPHFYMQCFFKYLGYKLGKNYRSLPRKLIFSLTSNREYWNRD